MLRLIHRKLFFSVPPLKNLSDAEKAQKLKEMSESFAMNFNKDHQNTIRKYKDSFSQEQNEKLSLILEQMTKLNTYEIMALRKNVQKAQESEYNWPIFSRPNADSHRIKPNTEIPVLGPINNISELISKITLGSANEADAKEEVKEEVKEKPVEKTTFNIVLSGYDPASKVKFIKCVKDVLGLGLKESKDKVEEVVKGPVILFKSVSKESHGKVLEQLLAAGGQVEFQ